MELGHLPAPSQSSAPEPFQSQQRVQGETAPASTSGTEKMHTTVGPGYRGGDTEARQLKIGGQHSWKEYGHRHTSRISRPTPTPHIQADMGGCTGETQYYI